MQSRPTAKLSFTDEELKTLLAHFPHGICAFDFEMTGLSPIFDKIIEVAAVKITKDAEVETFHSLINPLIPIPESTIQYHNITNEDVREAPSIKRPLRDFIDFFGTTPLLAHNAIYDASFLIRAMHENNHTPGLSDVYDSCRFARGVYKNKENSPENFKLSTLAEFFKLDFSHHQALDDAYAAVKVFAGCLLQKKYEPGELKQMSFLFKMNSFKKPSDYFLPNKLKGLQELVQSKTPFLIKYKGGSFKGEYRKVKPLSVLSLPQGLVMYAECLESDMFKYFQVKKIQSFQQLD